MAGPCHAEPQIPHQSMTDENNNETAPDVSQPTSGLISAIQYNLAERLHKTRSTLLWTGVGFTILGLIALSFPVLASVVTGAMIGWLLIFSGLFGLFASFAFRGAGPFFGALLTSLLTVAVGVYMIRHPGITLQFLTIFVAVVFLVDGAFTTGSAFDLKPTKGWGWMLFSAIISILAGIMIIGELPVSSLVVLGILVGVRFLSGGISSIMVARVIPKDS